MWKEHCQSSLTVLSGNKAVAHCNLAEFRESHTSSQNVILKADFPGAPHSLDEILPWSFESVGSAVSQSYSCSKRPWADSNGSSASHRVLWGAFTSITRDDSILPHPMPQLLFAVMKLVISSTEIPEFETEEICRSTSLHAESMLSSPHSHSYVLLVKLNWASALTFSTSSSPAIKTGLQNRRAAFLSCPFYLTLRFPHPLLSPTQGVSDYLGFDELLLLHL